MKKIMYAVITNPVEFAKGQDEYCFHLFTEPQTVKTWINLGPVELDLSNVNMKETLATAVGEVDRNIIEARAAFSALMDDLQSQRSSLLAITFETTGEENDSKN